MAPWSLGWFKDLMGKSVVSTVSTKGKPSHVSSCQLWYVVFPMMLFFFCFSFQSFMLHIATALYVRYMDRREMGTGLTGCKETKP
jgi:hypothetical protein